MKSFIEYREWQDVKKLANRAANLMVELDIDVEDSANLLFDYSSFSVQMSLCFMLKKQERSFKFFV